LENRGIGRAVLEYAGGRRAGRKGSEKGLRRGGDLVADAFGSLLPDGRLIAYRYDGFWQSMDTFKDKQRLDDLYARGDAPWEIWKQAEPAAGAQAPLPLPRPPRRALRSR